MNAMNAGQDVHIVAMGDILIDRVQEKRTSLKLKYPDQVEVPDATASRASTLTSTSSSPPTS